MVLICTIRAGRWSAHVARLLLSQLEGCDEFDIALNALVNLDLPVMRHRLGQTDAAPPGIVRLSEKLSRADGLVIVAPK
jgi:NAD(P)H-dependent FMN reductase